MEEKLIKDLFFKRLIIFKPSFLFWLTSIFCLFVWLYLGPLHWRHYDDYEVFNEFLSWLGAFNFSFDPNTYPTYLFENFLNNIVGENGFLRLIFVYLWVNLGFGSLPPIFNSIYLSLTSPFLFFGIDATRFVLIFLGFFTNLISACLLSSVIKRIFLSLNNYPNLKIIKNLSDLLCVSFITLNPEILLHSQTYMPYQLPMITTLLFINVAIPETNNEQEYLSDRKNIFKISQFWKIFLILFSLLLGFQSIVIVTALVITVISQKRNFYSGSKSLKYKFNQLKKELSKFIETNFKFKKFNRIKIPNIKTIIFGILFFAFLAYIYRFLFIFKNNIDVGQWTMGENNIYYLKYQYLTIINTPIRIYSILTRLASLSLYPFRDLQSAFGLLFLIFIVFSWNNLYKASNFYKNLNTFFINLILVILILSFFGKFNFSPTRHNLFILPIIWIPVIYQIIKYFSDYGFKKKNLIVNFFLLISILSFYSIGCIRSFNQINYTNEEKKELISIAEESDLFPSSYGQYDYSLFWTHGSKEFNSVKDKFCKGPKNHKKSTKAFLYSHRNSFNPLNVEQRKFLEESTNGCIPKGVNLKVLRSIERKNTRDIEMDNQIYNGGSSIYGYLVEIE